MNRVVFSKAAVIDRREITAYTVERFGLRQAQRLLDVFQVTVVRLAESRHLGRAKPELDPPGRSFLYFSMMRRFVIAYEPSDDGIRVARILHGARLIAEELDLDAGDDG